MDNINVLFTFQPWVELESYIRDKLSDLLNVELLIPESSEKEIIEKMAPNADIIFGWRPWKELIQKAKNLKLIIQPGTGAESLISVMQDFRHRGIILTNGHGHSYGCAQHMVALLHSLTNHIIPYHQQMLDGKWRERGLDSIPLKNRKVGLLGYGPINQWVHKFLSGYDVEFYILKRSWTNENTVSNQIKQFTPSRIHEFLEQIDILLIALPLTSSTKGLIGQKELELLGKDGLLVNIARGSIIDQKSLFHSLKSNLIAGAAIDVWYNYSPDPIDGKYFPYSPEYPFHTLNNIILSPHRAGTLRGGLERWNGNIENIVRMAEGRSDFVNIIDMELEY